MSERGAAGKGASPAASDWADALLTSGSEALLGAVRNYLGPVKTPYDKRELARRLEAFLRRADTREAVLSLLDGLDARILGSCLLAGPLSEQALKDLFLGELPLFELGLRISNLLDRLLLFRYAEGSRRLLAVNPLLREDIRERVMDPALLFGAAQSAAGEGGPLACDAESAVGFFSFLFHAPSSLRKGGSLTKRAAERAGALFLGSGSAGSAEGSAAARLDAMARALARSGALRAEGEAWSADGAAFSALVEEWGEGLPFLLAALLAPPEEARAAEDEALPGASALDRAASLARLLERAYAAMPEGAAFSRQGLARWLRISALRDASLLGRGGAREPAGTRFDALGDLAAAVEALEALGIEPARRAPAAPAAPPSTGPLLVAEGAHALHLLPEAGLEDRLFVGCLARPVSFGKVWSFEVDRETARAAFAAGIGAERARARLEALAARPLPQSLAFSLGAWEEEYRSLRLYRGLALVADERQRPLVERGIASGILQALRLAEGVYFLSAAGPEEAAAQLARAGLEAPPEASSLEPRGGAAKPSRRGAAQARAEGGPAGGLPLAAAPGPKSPLDPAPRLALLRGELASSGRGPEEARELGDRIERRLVLTSEQIARSDPRPERMEAGGLDYLGKVRVVERALRSPGDRLEVLYRLPGAEPVRALLRPVKLDKNDKGLVLEAEDLGTGGPARVPLGSVSTVRRVRASLFGEES